MGVRSWGRGRGFLNVGRGWRVLRSGFGGLVLVGSVKRVKSVKRGYGADPPPVARNNWYYAMLPP